VLRQAGYRCDLSILQIDLSLAQVLDRPLTDRIFFEDLIRKWLDGTLRLFHEHVL
jgi:hypothetical protein